MFLGAPMLRMFVGSAPSPDKTEEAFKRGVDALRKCAEVGAELGMPVALQNHSGLTSTGDDMLRFKGSESSELHASAGYGTLHRPDGPRSQIAWA